MARTFISPSKYIQGPGEMQKLGEYAKIYGETALVLISAGGLRRSGEGIKASFEAAQEKLVLETFGGECTTVEIDRLTAVINDNKADVVIGVGGGKIFDTAKAAAYYADKPVIICPTIAATDAPCSALSVIYTPDGAVESYLFLRQNPDMVIMDSAVIAKSPVRLTVSGMAGVTEPAIYGITLPKKAPFIRTCIIAGIAGGVLGLAGVRCFAMASMGVFAFPGMINLATNDTKGMIICIVVAFASLALGVISELLFYKDDEPAKKTETKAAAAGDGVQSEDFVSPMTGEAIELSQVKDEVFSVRHISDRIAVMYLGKIVEIAGTDELYDNPLHPYTKALLSAIPDPEPDSGWLLKRVPLTGEITGSGEMRGGCAFAQRCPLATEECLKNIPALWNVGNEHFAACVHVKR